MKCGEWRAKASHKITIQEYTFTSDDYGGSTTGWVTQSTVFAMIKPISGREVFQSDQAQSRVTSKMVIRYQSALKNTAETGKYRVSYDGRLFPVKYVRNLDDDMKNEGKAFQELLCEENAATEDDDG